MYEYLSGKLAAKHADHIVVDCGGGRLPAQDIADNL